jgi:hypothetical protein
MSSRALTLAGFVWTAGAQLVSIGAKPERIRQVAP